MAYRPGPVPSGDALSDTQRYLSDELPRVDDAISQGVAGHASDSEAHRLVLAKVSPRGTLTNSITPFALGTAKHAVVDYQQEYGLDGAVVDAALGTYLCPETFALHYITTSMIGTLTTPAAGGEQVNLYTDGVSAGYVLRASTILAPGQTVISLSGVTPGAFLIGQYIRMAMDASVNLGEFTPSTNIFDLIYYRVWTF
jgi:hypothetical protein